jgi:hypothetical protein
MKRNSFLPLAGLLAASLVTASADTIYVRDTWADGNRNQTETGVDSDLDGDIESAWFGNNSSLSVTPGTLTGTPSTSSRQWITYFAASPIALLNDGDSLKVTLQFTPTTLTPNSTRNMRFGLFNYSGGTRLTADGTPGGTGVTGYSSFVNFAPTFGTSSPLQLLERTNVTSTDLQGTTSDFSVLGSGGSSGGSAFTSGALHTLQFQITRTSASSVNASVTFLDSANAVIATASGSDATGVMAFDSFAMRPGSTASTAAVFNFSLFEVEYINAVPEPSTGAILGLAAVLGWLRFRRRNG